MKFSRSVTSKKMLISKILFDEQLFLVFRQLKTHDCKAGLIGSEQGRVAGSCERGNGPSSSIKCGEFLD